MTEWLRLSLLRDDQKFFERDLAALDAQTNQETNLITWERQRIERKIQKIQADIESYEKEMADIADLSERQQELYMGYREALSPKLAREATLGTKIVYLFPGRKFVINKDGDDTNRIVINDSGMSEEEWVKAMGSF